MKFEELNLNEKLKSILNENGFLTLTPIQEKSIPYALEGRDVTGLAQTGTGKTLSFLLPIINKLLNENLTGHIALILAPTRELVLQIKEEAIKLLKGTDKKVAAFIGGTDYKSQFQEIEDKTEILVATPGRLIDHLKSGKLDLKDIKFFVLDEADRMFDMGFIKDIRYLMKKCPPDKQTMMFSATMSYYIVRLASDYLNNPVEISIEPEKVVTENIDQNIIHLGREEKIPYLLNLILNDHEEGLGIIFTNTKILVPEIVNKLAKYGIATTGISSHLDQKKRVRLLKDFKIGKYKYMVATDVASRGIDIDNIKIVYNFDLPFDTENYVHRIGRTARAGRKGKAVSFCSEIDYNELEKIEKLLGNQINSLPVNENYIKFPEGEFVEFQTEKLKPVPNPNQFKKEKPFHKKDKNFKPSEKKPFDKNNIEKPIKPYEKKPFDKNEKSFEKKPFVKTDKPFVKKDYYKNEKKSEIDIALDYLQKADSVLDKEVVKDLKPNHKQKFKKDKKSFDKKPKEKFESKEKNYDKSKRNLYDINESNNSESKKNVSVWKKIKSIFGL